MLLCFQYNLLKSMKTLTARTRALLLYMELSGKTASSIILFQSSTVHYTSRSYSTYELQRTNLGTFLFHKLLVLDTGLAYCRVSMPVPFRMFTQQYNNNVYCIRGKGNYRTLYTIQYLLHPLAARMSLRQ